MMNTNTSGNSPITVLFVCTGNICRSPAAEGIFQSMVDSSGLSDRIRCDSAGTIGYHSGEPADRRMREAAQQRGYQLLSRSRKLLREDFLEFDHIIAMDQENLAGINRLTSPQDRARVSMMCDFASNFSDREVPDPYYGGQRGFEHVMDLLEDACSGLLDQLRQDLPKAL